MLMEGHICRGEAQEASEWAAKLDRFYWDESRDAVNVSGLLDPKSPAYEKHPMWRVWVDAPPGKARNVAEMMAQLAALAGPGGSTMVPGGAGMIFHPGMKF
jgi:hypothetical protein